MDYYSNFWNTTKSRKRVFISFDYDHDEDLKNLLVGQAKNDDTPFEIADWSVKEELSGDWKKKVREIIKKVGVVIIICGEYTDTASGVSVELKIAQEENIPYFLLWGRKDNNCKKPNSANEDDKIYEWTWENLKKLINGER
jgi:hypothetical protein